MEPVQDPGVLDGGEEPAGSRHLSRQAMDKEGAGDTEWINNEVRSLQRLRQARGTGRAARKAPEGRLAALCVRGLSSCQGEKEMQGPTCSGGAPLQGEQSSRVCFSGEQRHSRTGPRGLDSRVHK